MEYTHFLTVKAYVFVLKLGKPSTWIPLAKEVSVSLYHDGIKGPYCFSSEGVRLVLYSRIVENTKFKMKSKVFGYWMDEATEKIFGIGFRTAADLTKFTETFNKVKLLLNTIKPYGPEHHEEVEVNLMANNPTPKPLALTKVGSYSTPSAPEEKFNGPECPNITGTGYLKLLPPVSSKNCLGVSKWSEEINELRRRCIAFKKSIIEFHNKKKTINQLQREVEDERRRKDTIEKLLNFPDEKITALREALGRSEKVDGAKENELFLRLVRLNLSMETKKSALIEISALPGRRRFVHPRLDSDEDLDTLFDGIWTAIKNIRSQKINTFHVRLFC